MVLSGINRIQSGIFKKSKPVEGLLLKYCNLKRPSVFIFCWKNTYVLFQTMYFNIFSLESSSYNCYAFFKTTSGEQFIARHILPLEKLKVDLISVINVLVYSS
jgi:hypothetical protein